MGRRGERVRGEEERGRGVEGGGRRAFIVARETMGFIGLSR